MSPLRANAWIGLPSAPLAPRERCRHSPRSRAARLVRQVRSASASSRPSRGCDRVRPPLRRTHSSRSSPNRIGGTSATGRCGRSGIYRGALRRPLGNSVGVHPCARGVDRHGRVLAVRRHDLPQPSHRGPRPHEREPRRTSARIPFPGRPISVDSPARTSPTGRAADCRLDVRTLGCRSGRGERALTATACGFPTKARRFLRTVGFGSTKP